MEPPRQLIQPIGLNMLFPRKKLAGDACLSGAYAEQAATARTTDCPAAVHAVGILAQEIAMLPASFPLPPRNCPATRLPRSRTPTPWREATLEGWRRRNAVLDATYDAGKVTRAEAACLSPWLAKEGAIRSSAHRAPSHSTLCPTIADFERRWPRRARTRRGRSWQLGAGLRRIRAQRGGRLRPAGRRRRLGLRPVRSRHRGARRLLLVRGPEQHSPRL